MKKIGNLLTNRWVILQLAVVVIICALGLLKELYYTTEGLAIPQRMATPPEGWEYVNTSICLNKKSLSIVYDEETKAALICSCNYKYDEVEVDITKVVTGTKHPIRIDLAEYFWVYVGFNPETGEEGLWIPKSHREHINIPNQWKPPPTTPPPPPTKPPEEA